MNTKEYVESLINKNKNKLKEEQKKSFAKMNVFMAITILSAVFGIIGISSTLLGAVAAVGTSIAAVSGYRSTKKRKKMIEDAYEKENKHLEEIKSKGIKIDNTSKIERRNRYQTAKNNIEDKEKHIKNSSTRDNITCLANMAAGIGGFLLGGVFGIISPIIAGYKLLTDKAGNKDYEDYMNSKVEYDNVCNEYRILSHARNTRNNTRTTPTRVIPKRGKAKKYTREQLEAAEKYVDALSKINPKKENAKQIVKK